VKPLISYVNVALELWDGGSDGWLTLHEWKRRVHALAFSS